VSGEDLERVARPLVSGADGLRSLAVITAVIGAERTGEIVDVDELVDQPG
jgi:hypothetical protein